MKRMANNRRRTILVILVLLIGIIFILCMYCILRNINSDEYMNDLKVTSISIENSNDSTIFVCLNSSIEQYNGKIMFFKRKSSYFTNWFGKESLIMSTSNLCVISLGCEKIVISKESNNLYSTSVYSEINKSVLYKITYDKNYDIKQFMKRTTICYSKDSGNIPIEWIKVGLARNKYKEIELN